jgi:hypothetical protein
MQMVRLAGEVTILPAACNMSEHHRGVLHPLGAVSKTLVLVPARFHQLTSTIMMSPVDMYLRYASEP